KQPLRSCHLSEFFLGASWTAALDQGGCRLYIYSRITFLVVKRNQLFWGIERSVGVSYTVL
ncbi:hypothetical protein LEMLEM_LOCUS9042, partial [Lemmus lemmus]